MKIFFTPRVEIEEMNVACRKHLRDSMSAMP